MVVVIVVVVVVVVVVESTCNDAAESKSNDMDNGIFVTAILEMSNCLPKLFYVIFERDLFFLHETIDSTAQISNEIKHC